MVVTSKESEQSWLKNWNLQTHKKVNIHILTPQAYQEGRVALTLTLFKHCRKRKVKKAEETISHQDTSWTMVEESTLF